MILFILCKEKMNAWRTNQKSIKSPYSDQFVRLAAISICMMGGEGVRQRHCFLQVQNNYLYTYDLYGPVQNGFVAGEFIIRPNVRGGP